MSKNRMLKKLWQVCVSLFGYSKTQILIMLALEPMILYLANVLKAFLKKAALSLDTLLRNVLSNLKNTGVLAALISKEIASHFMINLCGILIIDFSINIC